MASDLQSWALPRLQRLLPLDDESLKEVITYTTSLSKEDGAEHLKNLLGDSAQALEFISTFNSRRRDQIPTIQHERSSPSLSEQDDSVGVPSTRKRVSKKSKPPLHNAGPVRLPEGYGNVSGAYQKTITSDNTTNRYNMQTPNAIKNVPDIQHFPLATHSLRTPSTGTSREASPSKRDIPKLPPSAAGNLISDLPNVRSKQSKRPVHQSHSQPQSGSSSPFKSAGTTTTSSIADLTSAIAALEVATNPMLSSERRKCPCNASIHPLFEAAPNCLNCGKIICTLEGLQPCSFCDSPILSKEQVNSMIRALKDERGVEKMIAHNISQSRSGHGTPVFGGTTPESLSGDESSAAAVRARAHRDKLLSFQRENAQRTKIHDEAADYDATLTPGTTQWMTPTQRAAALKKQQQYLRELEEANKPEWEKKRTVMSMSIKNGKLVRTFEKQKATAINHEKSTIDDAVEIPTEDDQHLSVGGKGGFSDNPLLASGKLIRPIWKSKELDGKGKGRNGAEGVESTRTRSSIWRRVQDDDNDNEKWLLDGGVHGFNSDAITLDDGSRQECG